MTTQADAPSENWQALPAVMFLSPPLTGSSRARPSAVVSGRLPSSLASVTSSSQVLPVSLSVIRFTVLSGTISSSSLPAACAAAVRCSLMSAYSSWASRLIP